jgi:hypothetical protein
MCFCVCVRNLENLYIAIIWQNCRKIHSKNISVYFKHNKKYHENLGIKVGPRPDYMNRTMKVREFNK